MATGSRGGLTPRMMVGWGERALEGGSSSSGDPGRKHGVTPQDGRCVTVAEARKLAVERLTRAGVASPAAEADRLLEAATGLARSGLLLGPEELLGDDAVARIGDWLERRGRREPLQHILGRAPFFGLELSVTPEVLIPRPETERLVELALERLAGVVQPRVLEVGTGSGAVALALKHERPDLTLLATDLSAAALTVASRNAAALALQVDLIEADLLDHPEVATFAAQAHLLVSNPPYLPDSDREVLSPEVRFDPELALFGGRDGLDLVRRLEGQARRTLRPGADLLLELDPRTLPLAFALGERWSGQQTFCDLTGRERFLTLTR